MDNIISDLKDLKLKLEMYLSNKDFVIKLGESEFNKLLIVTNDKIDQKEKDSFINGFSMGYIICERKMIKNNEIIYENIDKLLK